MLKELVKSPNKIHVAAKACPRDMEAADEHSSERVHCQVCLNMCSRAVSGLTLAVFDDNHTCRLNIHFTHCLCAAVTVSYMLPNILGFYYILLSPSTEKTIK